MCSLYNAVVNKYCYKVREHNRWCAKLVAVFLVFLAVVDGIFDQLRFLMQVKYVYLISLVGACVIFSLYAV